MTHDSQNLAPPCGGGPANKRLILWQGPSSSGRLLSEGRKARCNVLTVLLMPATRQIFASLRQTLCSSSYIRPRV